MITPRITSILRITRNDAFARLVGPKGCEVQGGKQAKVFIDHLLGLAALIAEDRCDGDARRNLQELRRTRSECVDSTH
jgi:hypothetical protein